MCKLIATYVCTALLIKLVNLLEFPIFMQKCDLKHHHIFPQFQKGDYDNTIKQTLNKENICLFVYKEKWSHNDALGCVYAKISTLYFLFLSRIWLLVVGAIMSVGYHIS